MNALIMEGNLYKLDADGTRIADMRMVRREFGRVLKATSDPMVVEGLLAHLLQRRYLTHVVVLRTHPKVLEQRLRARGYNAAKIRENVEAEALDIILWEAVSAHGIDKVYEIDMTELEAAGAVKLFLDALEGKVSLRPGRISWLKEIF